MKSSEEWQCMNNTYYMEKPFSFLVNIWLSRILPCWKVEFVLLSKHIYMELVSTWELMTSFSLFGVEYVWHCSVSQAAMCVQIPWGSFYNADSDSTVLKRGLGFQNSKKLPRDVEALVTLCTAKWYSFKKLKQLLTNRSHKYVIITEANLCAQKKELWKERITSEFYVCVYIYYIYMYKCVCIYILYTYVYICVYIFICTYNWHYYCDRKTSLLQAKLSFALLLLEFFSSFFPYNCISRSPWNGQVESLWAI